MFDSQNSGEAVSTVSEKPTSPYLIDKIADVVIQNEGTALIIASGITTSIIIYVMARSGSAIIKAWRSNK